MPLRPSAKSADRSRYATGDPEGRTSYSWRRDTTAIVTMDCFHAPEAAPAALAWVAANDDAFTGPDSSFSPGEDRRLLWASFHRQPDEFDLEVRLRPP